MLHRIFRLTDIKYIETITEDLEYGQDIVIVRPTYLSICAADQRYFFGKRKKAIMQKKLPLALIHEAVGVVVQDKSGTLARGTRVAMVPNISPAEHTIVKDNYSRDSKFCSSSADGFMQDLVAVPGDRLIPWTGGNGGEMPSDGGYRIRSVEHRVHGSPLLRHTKLTAN